MSRSRSCTHCADLEAQLKQWQADYRDLANAIARRDGYGKDTVSTAVSADGKPVTFSADPPLPETLQVAIEQTTAAFSEARQMAIEAARELLESGMTEQEVEVQLRAGDSVIV